MDTVASRIPPHEIESQIAAGGHFELGELESGPIGGLLIIIGQGRVRFRMSVIAVHAEMAFNRVWAAAGRRAFVVAISGCADGQNGIRSRSGASSFLGA